MSISLRNRATSTEETPSASGAGRTQASNVSNLQQSTTPQRGADTFVGRASNESAQRLDRISNPTAQVCRETITDAQLAAQYRETIARGQTPHIAAAPALPQRDGATLMRELGTAAPRFTSAHRAALNAETAPATGAVMPMVLHAVTARLGRHPDSAEMAAVEVIAHGAAELLAHGAAHLVGTALAVGAGSLVGPTMMADALIGSVLHTAYELNNGTLPPSHAVQEMMRSEGPTLLANARAQTEHRLEQQFSSGAEIAARGQMPPANASAAFRKGYEAGIAYRQQHGCEFDSYQQQHRVLADVTRGTNRDASLGVRTLSTAAERPSGIVSQEDLARLVRGE